MSDSVDTGKLTTKSWGCLALAVWGCLGGAACTDRSAVSDHPWVAPSVETAPVPSRGDAADDPAIWIHPDAPERSLIVATDKRSGIFVYDLAGRERQYVPAGNLNNVDLRMGAWGRQDLTIAVASGRQPAELVVFELDHSSGQLRVVQRNAPVVDEPYGICLYLDDGDQPWVVLNGRDGLFVQFELRPDYSVREARRWRTRTQPEGCVADDAAGVLYVGEENYGVWTLPADPRQPAELVSFAKVADGILSADVEGMALVPCLRARRGPNWWCRARAIAASLSTTWRAVRTGVRFASAGTTRSTPSPTPTVSPRRRRLCRVSRTECWSCRTATIRAGIRISSSCRGQKSVEFSRNSREFENLALVVPHG